MWQQLLDAAGGLCGQALKDVLQVGVRLVPGKRGLKALLLDVEQMSTIA